MRLHRTIDYRPAGRRSSPDAPRRVRYFLSDPNTGRRVARGSTIVANLRAAEDAALAWCRHGVREGVER